MKYLSVVILLLLLSGCAAFTASHATIILPNGDEYKITSSTKEGVVSFEGNGVKVVMDNKPSPGLFEKILTMMFMRTDVNIGVK